ncbi:MAG: hypothetical protein AAB486_04390 [Patescibacteria group bacterium]
MSFLKDLWVYSWIFIGQTIRKIDRRLILYIIVFFVVVAFVLIKIRS